MASTPPLQITGSPRTPPTPLHGASYDHEDSPRRSSARLRQKRVFEETTASMTDRTSRSAKTPSSPRTSNIELLSPDRTPQRRSTARRVQIMSPTSPDSDASAPKPNKLRSSESQPFQSSSTTLTEGMLPTPVKTPNKKQKTIGKSNIAARALFQDQTVAENMAPSPRRNRKTKRFNGFSLESFRAEDGENRGGIQIFTDSRDQVPVIDKVEEHPFIEPTGRDASLKKVTGTVKRRKVSGTKKMDPQVAEAIRKDEGMVYVFRGKKVYRRFDDTGEEEEEIDADDLGLLRHLAEGGEAVKPLKTLTRKSIRPTRLFQTEEQKRARELEKEEEAATDIDDAVPDPPSSNSLSSKAGKGKGKSSNLDSNSNEGVNGKTNGKKGSPFDTWRRLKPGSASSSSATKPTRGRKRAASESFEEPLAGRA